MKALILGSGGQLGRALCASAPAGTDIVALDRAACDLSVPARAAECIARAAPALVINAAAYTAVDRAESERELAQRINADAPGEIAGAAREAGARMVHVSTDFVFDGRAATPRAPDDRPAPLGVYGRTKLEGEHAVRAADPDALVVRTAWLYDARGGNFVNTMLRLMRERGAVGVVADQVGTPTWAPSLARAIWSLAAADTRGIHHFTDAGVASWYDFAVAIAEEGVAKGLVPANIAVRPIATRDFPTPAKRPAFGVLDKSGTWPLCGGPPPHWRVNLRACLQEIAEIG